MQLEQDNFLDMLEELESPLLEPVEEKEDLIDTINSLLAEIDQLEDKGKLQKIEEGDISDYYDYKELESVDVTSARVHKEIDVPENCIMIENLISSGVIVQIFSGLVNYFKKRSDNSLSAFIALDNGEGEYVVSNSEVEIDTDLLSTILEISQCIQDCRIRVKLGESLFHIDSHELLSKFICI